MPKNTHLEAVSADAERLPEPAQRARDPQVVHDKAAALASSLTWLPNAPSSHTFAERSRVLAHDFKPIFAGRSGQSEYFASVCACREHRACYRHGRENGYAAGADGNATSHRLIRP